MLISNVHKSIIVMNSLDTRFSKNVFEAVQKTRSTCFIGSKTTRLRLVVLTPIKHSCSFFKHYVNYGAWHVFKPFFGSSVATCRLACSEISVSINEKTRERSGKCLDRTIWQMAWQLYLSSSSANIIRTYIHFLVIYAKITVEISAVIITLTETLGIVLW